MDSLLLYLECAGVSVLGALFHLFSKLDSKQKTAKALKQPFTTGEFFKDERFAIMANVVAQAVLLLWTPELIKNYPALEGWVLGLNTLFGYVGSSFLSKILGAANKKLDKIIDDKTNT